MKKIIVIILCAAAVAFPAAIFTQTMSDYCSISPFVTRSVPPNITIILDNSAEMLSPAYHLTDYDDRTAATTYTGYFDPLSTYCAGEDFFYEAPGKCESGDKGPYTGALLNWATMSKFDMIMHVLIGGLGATEPASNDLKGDSLNSGWTKATSRHPQCDFTMSDDSLSITGAGCALQNPEAKIVVRNGRKGKGLIPGIADRNDDGVWDTLAPRIAVMVFQPARNDIAMTHCFSGANTLHSLYKAVAEAAPNELNLKVPFGKAIIRSIEFYSNICPACNACADPIDSVQCRKNFILSVGSGDATDVPSVYSEAFLFDEVRKAHISDIRDDRDGTQAIQFYSINISGSQTGKNLMKGLSRHGGFIDKNGNGLPDLNIEWDKNADGVPDTYFEASDPASIRPALEQAFSDINIRPASGTAVSMLSPVANGAGGVIQAYFLPVHRELTNDVLWTGYMQNIWADPAGHFREDSVDDYKLILSEDKIVKYFFHDGSNEPKAALFTTLSDGTGGTFSTCSNPEIKESARVKHLWEAGRTLALTPPSERTIFTSKKVLRGDAVTHAFPESPYPAFQTNMNSALLSALNPGATYSADAVVRYVRGECLEAGVTGDAACSTKNDFAFRDRRVTVNSVPRVWKLGDIMNSTPKAVAGAPLNGYHIDYADRSYYHYISDDRYKRKSSVVFAGANDGLLHAFRAGYIENQGLTGNIKAILKNFFSSGDGEHDRLGEEIWAYIPFNAFPYLKYLLDPSYCHINFNDLSVKVFDVSSNGEPEAARDRNSWRTILLGGMRFGGACGSGGKPSSPPAGAPANVGFSSYFAIDVTVPERPVPLWEFSDDDLGYASSAPAIVRTGSRMQNGNWYVVFGSGSKVLPNESTDIGRNAPGYLYLLNLWTGELEKKITLEHPAIVGDVLAIDADRDYVTESLYFGTSYKHGTVWMGKIISLNVKAVLEAPGLHIAWSPSFGTLLFTGKYPFTASPDAAKDKNGNIWIYGGSGKYFSDIDEIDTSQQIVFGILDKNKPVGEAHLFDASHVQTRGEVAGTDRVCVYDAATQGFGLKNVVTSIRPVSMPQTAADPGWKIYLSGGERVISRPAAVGGLLDFLAYKPDPDPCAYGGESYLYSVDHATGLAPARTAIRSPEITTGESGTVTVLKKIRLGSGPPPAGDAIVLQPFRNESERIQKNIHLATGVIAGAENRPLYSVISKIVHWLKK